LKATLYWAATELSENVRNEKKRHKIEVETEVSLQLVGDSGKYCFARRPVDRWPSVLFFYFSRPRHPILFQRNMQFSVRLCSCCPADVGGVSAVLFDGSKEERQRGIGGGPKLTKAINFTLNAFTRILIAVTLRRQVMLCFVTIKFFLWSFVVDVDAARIDTNG